jgi:threonyl-tRNA synthetase
LSDKQEEVISEALRAEEKLRSSWYILDTNGLLTPLDEYSFNDEVNLQKFASYEVEKRREVEGEPPHVELMRSLELVDYEPASDPGNMRYYPKGRMIKALLEEYVTREVLQYGGMEVETPIMYNMEHPTLAEYLHRFPARQYIIESDEDHYFLRFAACFGQFLMSHDAVISYRNLPMRIYELTKYSFRREQRGELTGLRRLRTFTMPDVHAFCRDLPQAKDEFLIRFRLSQKVLQGIGFKSDEYELGIRLTQEFWDENKEFVVNLVREHGRPALVEMWKERFFYFILKWEMNFIDALDKASALSTDQIDVENAERYGIRFMDSDGEQKHPLILHCSPSGAIERDIYAILEKAVMEEFSQENPSLPLWLSPTQIRLIPVSEDHVEYATKIAESIQNVRVDIDDRSETVGKKVRDAEKEWIPYIIVLGEREIGKEEVPVRIREERVTRLMKITQLLEEISEKVGDKPFRPIPLPRELQKRPKFVG